MEQARDGWRWQPWQSRVDGTPSGSSTVHRSNLGPKAGMAGWILAAWVEEDVAREWAVKTQGDACGSNRAAGRGSDGRGDGSGNIGQAWIQLGRVVEAARGAKAEVVGQ